MINIFKWGTDNSNSNSYILMQIFIIYQLCTLFLHIFKQFITFHPIQCYSSHLVNWNSMTSILHRKYFALWVVSTNTGTKCTCITSSLYFSRRGQLFLYRHDVYAYNITIWEMALNDTRIPSHNSVTSLMFLHKFMDRQECSDSLHTHKCKYMFTCTHIHTINVHFLITYVYKCTK
jgi:hypothetical protein